VRFFSRVKRGVGKPRKYVDFISIFKYTIGTMHHFLHILSLPDNVPIVIMMVTVSFLTWLSFREARANDKLIDEGKENEIYRRMVE
jgi:hypothetical protein